MSFLLIGTGGGNALRVTESVRAIIRGALEANHAMLTNDYRVDALLSGIQIVELYESIAVRALHALRLLGAEHFVGFEAGQSITFDRFLKGIGSGRFQPPLSENACAPMPSR